MARKGHQSYGLMVVHHFQQQIDAAIAAGNEPEVTFYYWMEEAPGSSPGTISNSVRRIILKNIDQELYKREFVRMAGNMPVFK